jgi:hypothetical protein
MIGQRIPATARRARRGTDDLLIHALHPGSHKQPGAYRQGDQSDNNDKR